MSLLLCPSCQGKWFIVCSEVVRRETIWETDVSLVHQSDHWTDDPKKITLNPDISSHGEPAEDWDSSHNKHLIRDLGKVRLDKAYSYEEESEIEEQISSRVIYVRCSNCEQIVIGRTSELDMSSGGTEVPIVDLGIGDDIEKL